MTKRKKQGRKGVKKRGFKDYRQLFNSMMHGQNKQINKMSGIRGFVGKQVLPGLLHLEKNILGGIPVVGKPIGEALLGE